MIGKILKLLLPVLAFAGGAVGGDLRGRLRHAPLLHPGEQARHDPDALAEALVALTPRRAAL